MVKRPPAQEEDFDINKIVSTDEHQKLQSRVDALERKENFVSSFCNASKESVSIQQCLNDVFIKLIQKDEECRTAIRKIVEDTDNRTFKTLMMKVGVWVLAGFTYILGLITQILIKKFLHVPD